jgi:hypothetical protein
METSSNTQIEFNSNSILHLSETRKWTTFISIIGFIFTGLCIILIPVIFFISHSFSSPLFKGAITTITFLVMALLYFFPIYYLFKFSSNLKTAIANVDSLALEISFKFLKFHYRFMGILIIVLIAVYAVVGLILLFTTFLK